jgi:DNA primase
MWAYRNSDGKLIGYMARYETPEDKEFCPWTWNGEKWQSGAWPKPWPLYGLDDLALRKDEPVLVCEGEKSADAARKLFDDHVVIAWPFGSNAVKNADWSPVYDRSVVLWPDADEPGRKAMDDVILQLAGHCRDLKIIALDDRKEGWDAALRS